MVTVDHNERHVFHAVVFMLSLSVAGIVISSLIHWLGPDQAPAVRIVVPLLGLVYACLLVALVMRPQWVAPISRSALVIAWLALMATSWGFTLKAWLIPGESLVGILPPMSAFLPVIMFLSILFFPRRWTMHAVILGWTLVAVPVLAYLCLHVPELLSPRGEDLMMAFGPWAFMVIVMLPMQRGLAGTIERLMSEQALMKNSINRDPLTDLYNRRLALQVLRDILGNRSSAGLIMFDLDRFKAINDTYGHPEGDRVLRKVAAQCRKLLRQSEIIARWGGEEFLVIVPEVGLNELARVTERLRIMIAELPVAPVERITASFGITLVRAGDHLSDLLERVDRHMYEAKEGGGNRVAGLEHAAQASRSEGHGVLREGSMIAD
jgi:diguanylate cyclase (GGDEF)-like protein